MTRRSIKVRQVFVELRRAMRAEIPAGELLKLAGALVDAAHRVERRDDEHRRDDPPMFDRVPLDRAFSDGGWRVMHREAKWVANLDEDPVIYRNQRHNANMAFSA